MAFKNKEDQSQYHRAYYLKNREKIIARTRLHKQNNKHMVRDWHFSKYRISYAERLAMGDNCVICGSTEHLCVDHCHETNEVRGLLCRRCNLGIGHLGDNPIIVLAAYNYLMKHLK